MELALIFLAWLTFLHLIFTIIELKIGYSHIKNLKYEKALPKDQLPFLSIIFTALNEEEELENALNSLLNLDYPHYEVIAVNDRSTDKTPDILERMQSKYPNLKVLHIHELPENWLGKNHALHFAAKQAKGEWYLFTDADVVMKLEAATKSMSYVLKNKLDHLTIYEQHLRRSFWLKVLLLGSYTSYSMSMKPWLIRYAWSKKSLGHGAFNLVKAEAYLRCGGHEKIAMECLDDLMLGKLLKANLYKQDIVNGSDYVEREWYSSVTNMINGLKKNSFAYFNFSLPAVVKSASLCSIYFIWPIFAAIIFTSTLRWINIANIILIIFLCPLLQGNFVCQNIWPSFILFLSVC